MDATSDTDRTKTTALSFEITERLFSQSILYFALSQESSIIRNERTERNEFQYSDSRLSRRIWDFDFMVWFYFPQSEGACGNRYPGMCRTKG